MTIGTWRQADIRIHPEHGWAGLAEGLAPELDRLVQLEAISGWWYIRKQVCRLRVRCADRGYATVTDLLDKLSADGRVLGWHPNIYEPETTAFGGPDGMRVAHRLFHLDSSHLLARAREHEAALGQRELTVILCAALTRGAGLDRYEQGDVWAKVAIERPVHLADRALSNPTRREPLVAATRRLLAVDAGELTAAGGPLPDHRPWITAFADAGHSLATLTQAGQLQRGLRAVLAHHIIFHANRARISVPDQSTMAALAMMATFGVEDVVSTSSTATNH